MRVVILLAATAATATITTATGRRYTRSYHNVAGSKASSTVLFS